MIPLLDHPLVLALLPLALIPLWGRVLRPQGQPSLAVSPPDPLSRLLDHALRLAGALGLAALVLGLTGPHLPGGTQLRAANGAHLVLLIDRSSSMDNTFADKRPDGSEESKSSAARRLLLDFVARRSQDRLAVAAFSTAPMLLVPLTRQHDAVRGAIQAIGEPGLAQTDVGRGLALAFGLFGGDVPSAGRAVVLVSDGAGVIAPAVQSVLRAEAARQSVTLYWLYLRSEGSKGIFEPPDPAKPDTPQTRPERHLHLFLQTLGVPYRAFEAESPEAVRAAITAIDTLESRPMVVSETVPHRPLAPLLFGMAAACLALLTLARLIERPGVVAAPRPLVRRPGGAP